MSKIDGRMVICDRCGESIFVKIKRINYCGSDVSSIECEDLPEGWGWHYSYGDMCPKCTNDYEKMLKNFFEKGESR